MKLVELHKELERELVNVNRQVKNIEYGGCGIFAVTLFDAFAKAGIPTADMKLVGNFLTDKTYSAEELQKVISLLPLRSLNEFYSIYLDHMKVKIGDEYFDNYGVSLNIAPQHELYKEVEIPVGQARKWNKESCWNKKFDRNDTPAIKQTIRQLFGKVKKLYPAKQLRLPF